MDLRKETRWLCENAKALEQFSGQWVMFDSAEGLVAKGGSLNRILKATRRRHVQKPFVFHVPSRRELERPLLAVRKK